MRTIGIQILGILPLIEQGRVPELEPYPLDGGSMDFWYTNRMPINAMSTNAVQDWPIWFWDRQAVSIHTGP